MARASILVLIATLAAVLIWLTLGQTESPPQARPLAETTVEAAGPTRDEEPTPGGLMHRWRQRADRNGQIPTGGLLRAARQRDRMMREQSLLNGGPFQEAALAPRNWVNLGPGNVGGRVRAIVIDPADPDVIYVGAASGGLWKSTNGGGTWNPLDDFITSLAVSCLAMDPSDSQVLYAGTGEGFLATLDGRDNTAGSQGAGVFRTLDGGVTWSVLPGTTTADFHYVNRIAIRPDDNMQILVGTSAGIFLSADRGNIWSTRHGKNARDLDFDPANNQNVLAGTADGLVLRSTDGGSTWSVAQGGNPLGTGRVELAFAPSNALIAYASVYDPSTGPGDPADSTLFRSTDGGLTFTAVNTGSGFLGAQGAYDNVLWVAPNDPDELVVGGIDLWYSSDNGQNLEQMSDWSDPASAHADHHVIVEHPAYDGTANRTVFFGNDGGIDRVDDLDLVTMNSGWTPLSDGLEITQFYGAAVSPDGSMIVGGTQDNGTKLYNGFPNNWSHVYGGDGGFCAIDPRDTRILYGEYVYGCVFRTLDRGANTSYICGQYHDGTSWVWKSAPYVIADARDQKANFIAPVVMDPQRRSTLFVGGWSLWRTRDARTANTNTTGPTWAAIKSPTGAANSLKAISAIGMGKASRKILYVGHNNGEIHVTSSARAAAPRWARIDTNGTLPARWVSSIFLEPEDSNVAYVSFMGYASDNVWKTTDRGQTWSNISGTGARSLPDIPVSSIVSAGCGLLYVGTDLGIYSSDDDGQTWSASNQGPANVQVDQLLLTEQYKLLAVTHGRGIWRADLRNGCSTVFRASVSSSGAEGNNYSRDASGVSLRGEVVFLSKASNLVTGDTNGTRDVFVHDPETGVTERVSVGNGSLQGSGTSRTGLDDQISADGRFVVFHSTSPEFAPGKTTNHYEVLLRDRQNRTTHHLSAGAGGESDGASEEPAITADGSLVFFWSYADNLGPANSIAEPDLYVWERATGQLSHAIPGGEGQDGGAYRMRISRNGRYLVYISSSTNLIPGDTNGLADLFWTDRQTGTTKRVFVTNPSDAVPQFYDVSLDGSTVFMVTGAQLLPADTDSRADVYAMDVATGQYELISVLSGGVPITDSVQAVSVSDDGNRVVFDTSQGLNLIYLRERALSRTTVVSRSELGDIANNTTRNPSISPDGVWIVFQSHASNLVEGDTNGLEDAFVVRWSLDQGAAGPGRPGTR